MKEYIKKNTTTARSAITMLRKRFFGLSCFFLTLIIYQIYEKKPSAEPGCVMKEDTAGVLPV
jgi:hypothetical protein